MPSNFNNSLCLKLFILATLLLCTTQQQNKDQNDFTIDEQIQILIEASKNISFPSIREKYLYIYHPMISNCLEEIGQDFEPLIESVIPTGIGVATYGIAGGVKALLSAGVFKTGLFGAVKIFGTSLLGSVALPITLTGLGMNFLYNLYTQHEVKQKCTLIITNMKQRIRLQQVELLKQIKTNNLDILIKLNKQIANLEKSRQQLQTKLEITQINIIIHIKKAAILQKYLSIRQRL